MRIRTGYSFKVAVGHAANVMARLKEIGWQHAPIADSCSTWAWANWAKLAKAENMVPVFGVELAVSVSFAAKVDGVDYWTFYAIDDVAEIYKLIALATQKDHLKGALPCLSYAEAMKAKGCIKIAGERCRLDQMKPQKNLYVALSPAMPKAVFVHAKASGFEFVASSANSYPTEDDKEFYRVFMGRRAGVQTYPQHILTDLEWQNACAWFADQASMRKAIANRSKALLACSAKLPKAELLKPNKPKTLAQMCVDGAKKLGVNLRDPVYKARVDRELAMIAEKKYEDYFYIVAELVNWAKARMVVGPARGSSCGSLVCFLLGITSVDPIPYGLLFERFIDVTRSDLPDIDIDFSDANRDAVFVHARELYGKDRVARLGTVSHAMARTAIKSAAIALRVPQFEIDKVTDTMIERTSGDARANEALSDTFKATALGKAFITKYPEMIVATKIEGHPTNSGQHAAGLLLTQGKVSDYVAVDSRADVAMCDKRDVDQFGLLKIDALGLTQLSIFERTMELIGRKPVSGWLETLPLDDQAAFDVINKQHYAGVFQFNGIAVQSIAKEITIDSLNDLIVIGALGRPGPMGSGAVRKWVASRTGKQEPDYAHEMVKPFLEETLGIIIFQEQILKIGREIGDLSWADVTALRKAMSKSMGQDYFDQYGEKFYVGAEAKGMPPDTARAFWREMCTFGNYGFNKSHSVAYGLIAYWCLYLKAHHPVEFAAATLDATENPERQMMMLRELEVEGIDYRPVDPDWSGEKWQPVRDEQGSFLVGPLSMIKGIGPAKVRQIIDCRNSGTELPQSLRKLLEQSNTQIDTIYPVTDRIAELHPDFMNMTLPNGKGFQITKRPNNIVDVQPKGSYYEALIIGVCTRIAPKDLNEAVNVAKRGGGLMPEGSNMELNLWLKDDTDMMFAKIRAQDYARLAKDIIERGGVGTAIYAVKGSIPKSFRMLSVDRIVYLGDMVVNVNSVEHGGPRIGDNADTTDATTPMRPQHHGVRDIRN